MSPKKCKLCPLLYILVQDKPTNETNHRNINNKLDLIHCQRAKYNGI